MLLPADRLANGNWRQWLRLQWSYIGALVVLWSCIDQNDRNSNDTEDHSSKSKREHMRCTAEQVAHEKQDYGLRIYLEPGGGGGRGSNLAIYPVFLCTRAL